MAKKAANGQGNIRKRKNGTWEGRYTAGRDEAGKPIVKSIYGKTQKEVVEQITALTNDLNNGCYVSPNKITVGEWFDQWLSTYNPGVKDSTKAQYEYQIRRNIKPTLGNIQLQRLTTDMIQRLYNDKQKTLSPKSIKNLHGVFHEGLNKAVLCQYLKVNPCLPCELPRAEKREMKTVTGDDLKRFFEEIKGKQFEHLFFVDIFTGMRESEIIGLTWDCVDFERGIVKVEKQFKRERRIDGKNQYKFDTLKNDKKRIVTPAPVVFKVLKRVQHEQNVNRMKHGQDYENKYNLVFTDEFGGHLHQPTVWSNFKRRVRAIGLPDVRFHDLRHSFATISLENGDDIKTVSENLGHATVAFTLDTYGHVTEKMRKESADRWQRMYDSLSG